MQDQLKKLNQNIQQLEDRLRKINSPGRVFGLSVLKGFGYAIGLTLVFGIAISILAKILEPIFQAPFFQNLLNNQLIKDQIQQIK